MLRALFLLATNAKKEAISLHNVGLQARSAVLNIASSNTPLFMTTLTIDILQPRSVQHRKSVMQLVIFIIRKANIIFTHFVDDLLTQGMLETTRIVQQSTASSRGCGQVFGPKLHCKQRCCPGFRHGNPRAVCQDVRLFLHCQAIH